jgi:putative PIN family toxin of toxin-antitoxin system
VKIVLDTNVFISAIFFGGQPAKILQAWRDRKIQIVLSEEILSEYHRIAEGLSEKYPKIDIGRFFELLIHYSEMIETQHVSVAACEDSDDDKFLECAIASGSKLIVSGDKHLLDVSGYEGISVLKPREFVDIHLKEI